MSDRPIDCPDYLAFASSWMQARETSIRDRWFKHCPVQDWEDFRQDMLLRLWTRPTFDPTNPGWPGFVKRTIITQAINRARDSILSRKGLYHVGYMDRLPDWRAPEVGLLMDAADAVARAGSLTRRVFTHGETVKEVTHKRRGPCRHLSARYQRLARQVRVDRAMIRRAIVPYAGASTS